MEAYKRALLKDIVEPQEGNPLTMADVELIIRGNENYTINRNERGEINSRYLGDRYEPAIIHQSDDLHYMYHYYIFDGDIKDCTHPFYISYGGGKMQAVTYYSTKRIENNEPVFINLETGFCMYNEHEGDIGIKILDQYESFGGHKQDVEIKDYGVCDEMFECEGFVFKFAD